MMLLINFTFNVAFSYLVYSLLKDRLKLRPVPWFGGMLAGWVLAQCLLSFLHH